ncbi:MAG: YqaA family protein [Alphaproteobacteria bacterium]|jgi:membrane protein YqaA with SNARE-associated domain|nr:YqaA family protein [Alphaproteobacteria bacterium]|tara:strand:+ start:353 stop:934 length:582 start_codon:yes stop_codon:yes gene_type:complete
MLRKLYDWVMALAGRRHAIWGLAAVSFAESSFFPIPPDVLLIPMVLAERRRAWRIAAVCTLASALGGLLGYAIGLWLFEAVGQPLLEFYGSEDKFSQFQGYYNEWGAWIVGAGGFTPLPYKVITIASGVTKLDIGIFILASVVSRGLRFYIEAALLWRFGEPVRQFIERHLGKLTLLFFILLVGAFVLVKLLV